MTTNEENYSLFTLTTEKTDQGLLITSGNKKYLIFSKRSIKRQASIIENRIIELQKENKKLIWVAPFYLELYNLLSHSNFIWLSPTLNIDCDKLNGDGENQNVSILTKNKHITTLINSIRETDKFEILLHNTIAQLPMSKNILNGVNKIFRRSAIRIKTIKHFGKIWEYNFKRNLEQYPKHSFLERELNKHTKKPDIFLVAGPSLNKVDPNYFKNKTIWIADTCISYCKKNNITPQKIFCLDAGKGSYEHFIKNLDFIENCQLIVDQLVFPKILELPFQKISFYYSSNILCQQWHKKKIKIINETGNVLGLMKASFSYLFLDNQIPAIYGDDSMKHSHFVSHVNPSAYFNTAFNKQIRFFSCENYFFILSQKLYGLS